MTIPIVTEFYLIILLVLLLLVIERKENKLCVNKYKITCNKKLYNKLLNYDQ